MKKAVHTADILRIVVIDRSGVKGVSWNKKMEMWKAYIAFKKHYHVGYFSDLKDAIKASRIAEEKLFAKFLEKYNDEGKS